MKIVKIKANNIVFSVRPDEETYSIVNNRILFEKQHILDPTADQLEVITATDVPADFEPYKYCYINGSFTPNEDY